MNAHEFLIEKGIVSMAEQRGVYVIEKWLTEFAEHQKSLQLLQSRVSRQVCTIGGECKSRG
jgi:hypothetical protein